MVVFLLLLHLEIVFLLLLLLLLCVWVYLSTVRVTIYSLILKKMFDVLAYSITYYVLLLLLVFFLVLAVVFNFILSIESFALNNKLRVEPKPNPNKIDSILNQCSICIQCLAWIITFKKININTNEIETNNTLSMPIRSMREKKSTTTTTSRKKN